jgi:glycosyltransferase involved in cell wall biosynthesis
MKLSIIIPCYNEYLTIEKIIEKVNFILSRKDKYQYEIIVIDDYSSDGTRQILQNKLINKISKLILNDKNYGKIDNGKTVSNQGIILSY